MIALWLLACVEGPGGPVPLPDADYDGFVRDVQPVLVGCANPSCHGSADRPLEIYAPRRHRLDPEQVHRDTPLTDEELERNFDRARALLVDIAAPEDSPLLHEPLAIEAGGSEHGGGVQFEDRDDPGYRVLEAWIAASLEEK